MNEKDIQEMVQVMELGERIPAELGKIIATFRRRKNAICPQEFTISDLVACTMIYDLVRPKEKKPNG